MPNDQNGNPRRDESAGVSKDELRNEDFKNIADDGGKVKDTALAAIPALRGDQHAGLRYLIVKGHNLNFDPPFRNAKDARIVAAVGMLDAGMQPDAVVDVLLDDRLALSRTSKKGDEKRQMLEGEVQRAVSIRRGAEVAKKQAAGSEDENNVLVELNTRHFVSQEGGQWMVYTEEVDPDRKRIVVYRSSVAGFQLRYSNRSVMIANAEGKVEAKKLATWWLDHPRRHQYKRIAFLPGRARDPDSGTYNLWRDFAVEPKPGDWSLLKDHVRHIICRGVAEHYDYLIKWMANAIQHPDEQGWAVPVMRGAEGVGKGLLAQNFGSLFGQHFLHISNSKHLTGNFNQHLRDCVVLFADEAFWAGDKEGEGTLKMLITERNIPLEAKGRDVEMGNNYLHIMMATNAVWAIPAGPGARRFFALDVSDAKKGDREYFNAIVAQMADGGRAAMLYELKNTDLKGFEVRNVPLTAELLNQKKLTYSPEQDWWFDCLTNGRQLKGATLWHLEVPVEALNDSYHEYVRKMRKGYSGTSGTKLRLFLNGMMPEGSPMRDVRRRMWVPDPKAHPHDPSPKMVKTQVHHYLMPDLRTCRAAFDKLDGQQHDWPVDDDND